MWISCNDKHQKSKGVLLLLSWSSCSKFSWTTGGYLQPPWPKTWGSLIKFVHFFLAVQHTGFFLCNYLEFSLPRGFRYPMTGGLSCRSSANRGGAVLRHGRISRSRTWCLGTGLSSLRSFAACFKELDHKMVGFKSLKNMAVEYGMFPFFDTKPGGFAPEKIGRNSTISVPDNGQFIQFHWSIIFQKVRRLKP